MKPTRLNPLSGASLRKFGASGLAAMLFACPVALGEPAARGEGVGHPPQRPGLSPAQRRLMTRRAAEVRAMRDALIDAVGAPRPDQIGSGVIHVRGRAAGFRVLETQELPDGRCRAVVEVTLPASATVTTRTPVETVLTDYLEFRSGLLRSRHRCLEAQARLEQEIAQAEASARQIIAEALETSRMDTRIIDRALEDLEAKTVIRLSPPTTTATTGPAL